MGDDDKEKIDSRRGSLPNPLAQLMAFSTIDFILKRNKINA
jgi:hypothetical protein